MAEERKHTPGPWRAQKTEYSNDPSSYWQVFGPHTRHICQSIIADDPSRLLAEDEVNARLIAAAPDLLAALEWAVAQIESTHSGTWQKYDTDFAKARAAIKRATEQE